MDQNNFRAILMYHILEYISDTMVISQAWNMPHIGKIPAYIHLSSTRQLPADMMLIKLHIKYINS